MTEESLKRKVSDLRGVKKQASELLECAWLKGYVVGCEDGRKTARQNGKWIKKIDGLPHIITIKWFVCSICGEQKSEHTPYCPTCGACMVLGGEAE